MPWRPTHDLDTAFMAQCDRIPNEIIAPSVARKNLEAIGIDTSTPQTLFDAMEIRGLSFTVGGPERFVARIAFYEAPMNEHQWLSSGIAFTLIGAIHSALYVALRGYPEYLELRGGLRRDADPFE